MVRSYRNSWRYTCIDSSFHELKSVCTFCRNSSLLNYCHQTWYWLGKEDVQPFRHVVYDLRFSLQWMLRSWSSGLWQSVGTYVHSNISGKLVATSTLNMETACTYEILVSAYKTSVLHLRRPQSDVWISFRNYFLDPEVQIMVRNSFLFKSTFTIGYTSACNDIFCNKHTIYATRYTKMSVDLMFTCL